MGALLALLLVGGWALSAGVRDGRAVDAPAVTVPTPAPTSTPVPTASTAPRLTGPPRPGRAYPVRQLGRLADRSLLVSGRGSAELRFGRPPGGATRLHFICTGCDDDTWLSERVGDRATGPGRLADPSYVTAALGTGADAGSRGGTGRLLVRAPASAGWTVTLTPFDEVPLHRTSFDGLDDDVVAVRAGDPLVLGCPGPSRVRVLARPSGAAAYAVRGDARHEAGSYVLPSVAGADRLVLVVTCSGRWSLTLP